MKAYTPALIGSFSLETKLEMRLPYAELWYYAGLKLNNNRLRFNPILITFVIVMDYPYIIIVSCRKDVVRKQRENNMKPFMYE